MELAEYQKVAVEWCLSNRYGALCLPMGRRKTAIILYAYKIWRKAFGGKMLVVAPPLVAANSWKQEVEKWGLPFKVVLFAGTPAQRDNLLKKGAVHNADIVVLAYDMLKELTRLMEYDFKVLVLDEAHRIKNHASKRFELLKPWRDSFDARWLLTGTPAPNSVMDLFALGYMIHEKVFGKTISGFRNRYCHQIYRHTYMDYILKPGAYEEITKAFGAWSMTLTDEFMGGGYPELEQVDVALDLPPKARILYKKMLKNFVVELQKGMIVASNAAVKVSKLRQIASGFLYTKNEGAEWLHTVKIDACVELVSSFRGEPCLILTHFEAERDALDTSLREAGFEPRHLNAHSPPSLCTDFRDGLVPVLIGHPANMGEGLNLQGAGRHLVWLSKPWSHGSYVQTRGRLYRPGGANQLTEWVIRMEDTVDDMVEMALKTKKSVEDVLLDYMKGVSCAN